MGKKAENTAQKHVMVVRPYLKAYLPTTEGASPTSGVPSKHPEDEPVASNSDAWISHEHEGPRPWKYSRIDGLLAFEFIKPVTWGEARAVFAAAGSHVTKGYADSRSIVGRCAVLTRTSKMGCYSWNMPAGPTDKGGTCPGSRLGYRIWNTKPNKNGEGGTVLSQASQEQVLEAIRQAKEKNSSLRSTVPGNAQDARSRYICNGCYAMKGAYGNPSIVLVMEWRKAWRDWAVENGEFVDVMIEAIRLAREKSKKSNPQSPEEIAEMTHPNFFRIHDSGDFDSPKYFLAWLEICRKMPYINFWAPTRVWADPEMSVVLEKHAKDIPSNLAIRPSGLFFDGPYPVIPYLTAGATSTLVEVVPRGGGLKVSIPAVADNAWGCPAYLPSVIGGGALPKRKKRTMVEEETLAGEVLENPTKTNRVVDVVRKHTNQYGMAYVPDVVKDLGPGGKQMLHDAGVAWVVELRPWSGVDQMSAKDKAACPVGPRGEPLGYVRLVAQRNPVRQTFSLFPQLDEAARVDPTAVFYDALVDKNGRFVIDTHSGQPVKATKTNMKLYKTTKTAPSQAFQTAGACSLARDHNGARECRVCWNVSEGKRDPKARRLPVVYGKH